MDYTIFYREELSCTGGWSDNNYWDVFISAFNSSERVKKVFDLVKATNKHWIIQPDYSYEVGEYPQANSFGPYSNNEAEFIKSYFNDSDLGNLCQLRICIDITGFIKPYMMHLIFMLKRLGVEKIEVIYSEPARYADKEKTTFSYKEVF